MVGKDLSTEPTLLPPGVQSSRELETRSWTQVLWYRMQESQSDILITMPNVCPHHYYVNKKLVFKLWILLEGWATVNGFFLCYIVAQNYLRSISIHKNKTLNLYVPGYLLIGSTVYSYTILISIQYTIVYSYTIYWGK